MIHLIQELLKRYIVCYSENQIIRKCLLGFLYAKYSILQWGNKKT